MTAVKRGAMTLRQLLRTLATLAGLVTPCIAMPSGHLGPVRVGYRMRRSG
jgi:hypothetical protein